MIPLTNYDFQWGRSEVVIIYPDLYSWCSAQNLHWKRGFHVFSDDLPSYKLPILLGDFQAHHVWWLPPGNLLNSYWTLPFIVGLPGQAHDGSLRTASVQWWAPNLYHLRYHSDVLKRTYVRKPWMFHGCLSFSEATFSDPWFPREIQPEEDDLDALSQRLATKLLI